MTSFFIGTIKSFENLFLAYVHFNLFKVPSEMIMDSFIYFSYVSGYLILITVFISEYLFS